MLKISAIVLGIYDLFLASGAIWLGVQMITLKSGTIFAEPFPESWATNLPFDSWVMPGILAVVIFGLGNIVAAILSFKKKHNRSWYASSIMGAVFLFGLTYQYIAVGEMYIVTGPFLMLGIVQLFLSGCAFFILNGYNSE